MAIVKAREAIIKAVNHVGVSRAIGDSDVLSGVTFNS